MAKKPASQPQSSPTENVEDQTDERFELLESSIQSCSDAVETLLGRFDALEKSVDEIFKKMPTSEIQLSNVTVSQTMQQCLGIALGALLTPEVVYNSRGQKDHLEQITDMALDVSEVLFNQVVKRFGITLPEED
jgi:hypothetical protein